MADSQTTPLNPTVPAALSYNPISAAGCAAGQPVYQTSTASTVGLARANVQSTTYPVGLVTRGGAAGERVNVQYGGPLELTEAEWNTITGSSTGLTPGAVYYVSTATAGFLTTTPPDDDYAAPVGIATSPTTMMVQISLATVG
jgi:hypothetical protein